MKQVMSRMFAVALLAGSAAMLAPTQDAAAFWDDGDYWGGPGWWGPYGYGGPWGGYPGYGWGGPGAYGAPQTQQQGGQQGNQ